MEKNLKRISSALNKEVPSFPKEEASRFLKKIGKTQLFSLYLKNKELSKASNYMLDDMLNCTPEAPKETIKRIFNRFYNTAIEVKDKKIIDFFEQCINVFDVLK